MCAYDSRKRGEEGRAQLLRGRRFSTTENALAARFAERQVVLDRPRESLLQFRHGFPLEGDDIPKIDHLAMENPGILVVFDGRLIAFVGHHGHGVIPASVRKRRTDLTAPLSVSFWGCGR